MGGLDPTYAHVIELQHYSKFDEVCVLSHKVKQQKKFESSIEKFSSPHARANLLQGELFPPPKSIASPSSTIQKNQLHKRTHTTRNLCFYEGIIQKTYETVVEDLL